MTILLSAPHAGCYNHTYERDCDLLAEKAANYLSLLIPESELYVGHAVRDVIDLNRDESHNDPFRVELRHAAERLNPTISLDIHSFPTPELKGADLAVLDEGHGTDYGRNLYTFLKSQLYMYTVKYFSGKDNSIMTEMRNKGIPAVLIEFNEDLTDDDLSTIDIAIIDWLTQEGYIF